jgi:hypothetical protein
MGIVLSEVRTRRWLVNAHALNGPVMNAGLTIPGFGNVRLPSVPLSSLFFEISESDRTLRQFLPVTVRNFGKRSMTCRLTMRLDGNVPGPEWEKPGRRWSPTVTYSHVPNRSASAPAAMVTSGTASE